MIAALVAVALAAAPGPALPAADPASGPSKGAPDPAAKAPEPKMGSLSDVVGTVVQVDRADHRVTVRTASGPQQLQLDRNTLVYLASHLGTVLDVQPGAEVRAGRNADGLAYWISVRAPPPATSPTTGQGSAATGGKGPPPAETGAPAAPGPGGGTPPAPGAVTPGPSRPPAGGTL